MEGSAPNHVGRPSKVAPYAPQITQWLREDPHLSSAEILGRVRLAGYRGGKSALYEFVRQLKHPPGLQTKASTATRQTPEAVARRNAPAGPAAARYLVIAAPDREELYEYFKQRFSRAATIEIVRERRLADRRQGAAEPPLERRRRDRRAPPAFDAELRAFGFAIVVRD